MTRSFGTWKGHARIFFLTILSLSIFVGFGVGILLYIGELWSIGLAIVVALGFQLFVVQQLFREVEYMIIERTDYDGSRPTVGDGDQTDTDDSQSGGSAVSLTDAWFGSE